MYVRFCVLIFVVFWVGVFCLFTKVFVGNFSLSKCYFAQETPHDHQSS